MLNQITINSLRFVKSNFSFNRNTFLLPVSLTAEGHEVETSQTVRQEGFRIVSKLFFMFLIMFFFFAFENVTAQNVTVSGASTGDGSLIIQTI